MRDNGLTIKGRNSSFGFTLREPCGLKAQQFNSPGHRPGFLEIADSSYCEPANTMFIYCSLNTPTT